MLKINNLCLLIFLKFSQKLAWGVSFFGRMGGLQPTVRLAEVGE